MKVHARTGMSLVLIVTLLQAASAQSVYRFLRNDVSPRIAAMGGAFTSMLGDPNSLFVNPAALGSVDGTRLSVSYMDHMLDMNAGSIALSLPETPAGKVTVGVLFLHYGTFERTDQAANSYGSFTASDLAFSVGSSIDAGTNLTVGAALKFIHSDLGEYTSSAFATDLGALYRIPDERISLGLSVLHLGGQLSTYAGATEPLPTDIRVGITKRPEHLPVLLNFNFHGLNESDIPLTDRLRNFTFGAEFDMSESLRLRVGYNNRVRKEMRMGTSAGLAGFSVGTGIFISSYRLDYAFNSYGAVGGLHRLGITAAL